MREALLRQSRALIALGALVAAGSGCMDGGPVDDSAELQSSHLVLTRSFPGAPGTTSYARVKDRLRLTPQKVHFHNNGSIGGGDVYIYAVVTSANDGADLTAKIKHQKRIRDDETVSYPTTDLVFDVERLPNQCFYAQLWAASLGASASRLDIVVEYCWDELALNWMHKYTHWRRDLNYQGSIPSTASIGLDETQYLYSNKDFDVTFYWRLDWIATAVNGSLDGRSVDREDGPEWHHLPAIPWVPFSSLTGYMTPIFWHPGESGVLGDPDLYASTSGQPSWQEGTWGCRPYQVADLDETCVSGLYYSVRNFASAPAGYDLVVDQGSGGWTQWFNIDQPTGNGDGEHLSEIVAYGYACAKPLAVQCRRASDRVHWMHTGESYSCTEAAGGVCNNSAQMDGSCDDYEVRFYCP